MPITYPLTLPTHTGIRSSRFELVRRTAVVESPFSGKIQVHSYDSFAQWKATIELPRMKKPDWQLWTAFFLKLRGRRGTFLMGDPDYTDNTGLASGTLTTSGAASAGANSVTITGLSLSQTNSFKAGDYISLNSQLLMIIDNANSNGSGNATVEFEPQLKADVSSGTSVKYSSEDPPVGKFRLDTDITGWDADMASTYIMTFSCTEAT